MNPLDRGRKHQAMRRIMVLLVLGICARCDAGAAQSLRDYEAGIDVRINDLERRIEILEQDRRQRLDAEHQTELQRQQDAVTYLAAQCRAFQQNPDALKLFNECQALRRAAQPISLECAMVEHDESDCHPTHGYQPH